MVKKVCVVTGNRAEYGLLRWVIQGIQNSSLLDLQLIVTGAHLSPDFGLTVQEIEQDGFPIDYRVEMLLSSDTCVGVTKSLGLGVIGFADALDKLKPDVLLVLGDRYEILAATAAALVARIPIAHIHGGELTEGAIDDAIRHAITKMSHLHFVAADEYLQRVIQMGETPERVFNVGGLGVEAVRRTSLLNRVEVERALGIQLTSPSFLVTYHPVTLDLESSANGFGEVLQAFKAIEGGQFLFTEPNADPGGKSIHQMITDFCVATPNAHYFKSMGQHLYLSTMAQVDAVVGNSSSGLLEAPAMGVGTVNIGDRQDRRLRASSVIDCDSQFESVQAALIQVRSKPFLSLLGEVNNPYGSGETSSTIVTALENQEHSGLLKKVFHDL